MTSVIKEEKKLYNGRSYVGRIYSNEPKRILILLEKYVTSYDDPLSIDKAFRLFGENISVSTWKSSSRVNHINKKKRFSEDISYRQAKKQALELNGFHGALNTSENELYVFFNGDYYESEEVDFIYKEDNFPYISFREDGRKICASDVVEFFIHDKVDFETMINEYSKVYIRLNENALTQPIQKDDFNYSYF
jgi:hypothetical protein